MVAGAHDYQELTADALYEADGVVAVLPMGAGKSLATLMALTDLFKAGEIDRAVIFAPKRVAEIVWPEEVAKWRMPLDLGTLAGLTPKKRAAELARDPQVLVVNYELAPWLEAQGWSADGRTAVVFDEVSRLKNAKGRRRKNIVRMTRRAKMRWGLTGTPKGNSALDLWGQADIVRPDVWGGFYAWRARYFRPVDRDGHQWKVLPGCEEIIDEEFSALAFRLSEGRIPRHEAPTLLVDRVRLPEAALRTYREFEGELIAELESGAEITAESAAAAAMKCRQIASGTVYDDDGGWQDIHTAKLSALQDIVEDSGEPVLVFYQFLAEVEAMRSVWPDLAVLGGETKNAAPIVEAWNRGEVPVLAGHPASMGHGLNMQYGGRRAVWYSLTWSMEEYQQANARLARQGQTQQVYIHHLLADRTIDRTVYRALQTKTDVQTALLSRLREVA